MTMTLTRTCRHWFQLVILVNLLLFQRVVVAANEQTVTTTGSNAELEDSMYNLMDSILEDLTLKYDKIKTDDFWHPYDFGTGNDNREVINVVDVLENQILGSFIQWKKVQLGLKQRLVGLTATSIQIYDSKLKEVLIKDMGFTLNAMEVFTRWDTDSLSPFMVIVVATSSPSILMLTMSGQEQLKEVGSFPLSSSVHSMMLCNVENSEKIMLVPESSAVPISIYNIEISQDEAQLWFFQRISEPGFESAIVHRPDTVDSMLAISRGNQLNIYQYDASLGQFGVKQTLPLPQKCGSMLSFTMMYQHYLGCMTGQDKSEEIQFIAYNFNMNEYEESTLKKVKASEMLPVAIAGSRGDVIFVTKGVDDSVLNTLIYDGQSEFKTGNIGCTSAKCEKLTALSKGVSFEFQDNTALVFPTSTQEDSATVLTFMTELTATSSPVLQQSKGLFDEFKTLSKDMNTWRTSVSNAEKILEKKVNTEGNNVITGNWVVSSLVAEDVDVDMEGREGRASDNVFNMLKFGNVHWTEEDFASTNADILSNMEIMKINLRFISNELDDALLKNGGEQTVKSEVIFRGNIMAENAKANKLNVKSMWERDAAEFFQSLAHQQSEPLNIKGALTFTESFNARHLETKKLNNILVDDLAVLSGHNVFECPTTFENLHALRDVSVSLVNSHNLVDSVIMAHDVSGFHFADGILVFMGAQVLERHPFDDVLLSSVPQTVESPMLFNSVEMHGPASVDNLNGEPFKAFSKKVITKGHQGKITGTKKFTGSVNLKTLFITDAWNGLAFPTDFFSVTNDFIVLNGENSFADIVANKVSVAEEIDGINTDDLVSLTQTHVMDESEWIFNGKTKILNNIAVQNTVDGVLMESLLHQGLLDSTSTMFSPNADIVFKQPVHIEDLSVSSTVNDNTFDELFGSLILFEGTDCRVPGTTMINEMATFADIELHDNKINDFSVENFLTRDTFQTISKPVVFTESVFFEEMQALDHFDEVRVQDVLEKAMRVSAKTESKSDITMIPWDVHFESIQCQSSFTVDGPVNDLAAYGSSVARTKGGSDSQIITGPIESISPVFSTLAPTHLELDSGRTLQTLDVNTWNTKRAKLSDAVFFTEPFSANGIKFHGSLETPNINGIDVDDLKTTVFRNNGMLQHFSGPIKLNNGLTVLKGDLHFLQAIDGFVLEDYIENGFPLKTRNPEPYIIKNGWEFESLMVNKGIQINGNVCGVDLEALETDSVKRNENNIEISGEKSFSKNLEITNSLKSPQVNGKDLENAFFLNKDQEVVGHPTFASDVSKDVLIVDSINNVDMEWLKSKHSVENGKHVLDHDTFISHNLKSHSLSVRGKTRSHDLEEFVENSVKLDDPNIEFKDNVEMINPITVDDQINTEVYNGVNVDELSSEVVMLDENIKLTHPISFTDKITAENVLINGDLKALSLTNGIDWDALQENSIKLNAPGQEIKFKNANFENLVASKPISAAKLNGRSFEDFITLNSEQNLGKLNIANVFMESSNVEIKGKLGSHDISEEFKDTLMKNINEPQRLSGTTVINGPVHVKQDISCFGEDFRNDVVTTSEDLVLGPVEFMSPIVVENDVELNEPLEGHDVKSMFSGAFMTDTQSSEQVISNQWEFLGPVTFLHDVTGKGVGDKVNIQAFVDTKNEDLRRAANKVNAERETFIRKCSSLHKIRNSIAKNPVKLDSFDDHQVIALKHEGTNVLAVESDNTPMLFVQTANCRIERYQWLPATELFHKMVEVSSVNFGNVDMWQSVALEEGGSLIVFSKSISACSNELGLFSVQVAPNGELSPVVTIRENFPVKSFKVAKKPDTGEVRLFNLIEREDPGVEVFEWKENEFMYQKLIVMEAPMDRVDVTASSRGFGLMCHNNNAVMMYDISSDHSNNVAASGAMLASKTGTMAVFESFDTLYALLPESGTSSLSLIQPTCNFQVMRLNADSIESVQKLQVPEVVSSTIWSSSNKNFISFLSKSHGLTVHKFMGLNGFQQIGKPYKVFGGFMLKSFSVKRSGFDSAQPFLLVLSKNSVEIFRGNVFGDSLSSDFEQLCKA